MAQQPKCRKRANELVIGMTGAVQSQLKMAASAFIDRDEKLAHRVIEKDDYIDNLYTYTESELFNLLEKCTDPDRLNVIRTALKTAKGLEKIADNAENIAKQSLHITDRPASQKLSLDIRHCYREAKQGVDLAVEAFINRDLDRAKLAAKKEALLDGVYRHLINSVLKEFKGVTEDPQFLLTQVLAAKYLEKIGDTLLDMAEEAVQLITGERLKLHQVVHLNRMAKHGGMDEMKMEGLWGTRSGSTIFKIESDGDDNFIYKDGNARKIKTEIKKLKKWNTIAPGLVPEVESTYKKDDRQAMVTSFIEGVTLQEIYQKYWWSEKELVTGKLIELLEDIWDRTLETTPVAFDAAEQIASRIEAVYSMHERFQSMRMEPVLICGIRHDTLGNLIDRVRAQSERLAAPFSIFIHGDFNTDNIIYKPEEERLQYIDVYRSRPGDYLQDVSVFMVSNLRMPSISALQRQEVQRVNRRIARFSRDWAKRHGDRFFEERLAILLGRSLITSTRFVGSFKEARRMFLKGIEKIEWACERLEA